MGKLYSTSNWIVKVQGNEHPLVHVHVLHPDGRAVAGLDGSVLNHGIPSSVITEALAWVRAHVDAIRPEWARMNNPPDRGTTYHENAS